MLKRKVNILWPRRSKELVHGKKMTLVSNSLQGRVGNQNGTRVYLCVRALLVWLRARMCRPLFLNLCFVSYVYFSQYMLVSREMEFWPKWRRVIQLSQCPSRTIALSGASWGHLKRLNQVIIQYRYKTVHLTLHSTSRSQPALAQHRNPKLRVDLILWGLWEPLSVTFLPRSKKPLTSTLSSVEHSTAECFLRAVGEKPAAKSSGFLLLSFCAQTPVLAIWGPQEQAEPGRSPLLSQSTVALPGLSWSHSRLAHLFECLCSVASEPVQ